MWRGANNCACSSVVDGVGNKVWHERHHFAISVSQGPRLGGGGCPPSAHFGVEPLSQIWAFHLFRLMMDIHPRNMGGASFLRNMRFIQHWAGVLLLVEAINKIKHKRIMMVVKECALFKICLLVLIVFIIFYHYYSAAKYVSLTEKSND